jgi:hypothetical protein
VSRAEPNCCKRRPDEPPQSAESDGDPEGPSPIALFDRSRSRREPGHEGQECDEDPDPGCVTVGDRARTRLARRAGSGVQVRFGRARERWRGRQKRVGRRGGAGRRSAAAASSRGGCDPRTDEFPPRAQDGGGASTEFWYCSGRRGPKTSDLSRDCYRPHTRKKTHTIGVEANVRGSVRDVGKEGEQARDWPQG